MADRSKWLRDGEGEGDGGAPRKPSGGKSLAIVVSGAVAAVVLLGCCGISVLLVGRSGGTRPPLKADLEANASGLWGDYGENEAAADAKYRGKWVLLTGDVHSVDSGRLNFTSMISQRSVPPPGVLATFYGPARGGLAKVKNGSDVKVIGRCVGRFDDPSGPELPYLPGRRYVVHFEDCELR